MNKIYKIVWSKVKNTYVVVSEVAKSHSKSGQVRGRVTLAAAVLGVLMATALPTFGVYAAGDTHYVSVKSNNQTADSNYDNQGAQAENSIAIGPSVKTTGEDNIVIGSGKLGSKKGSTSFNGQRVLVVGHGNYFQSTSDRNGQPVSYRDSAIIGHENKLLQGNADDAGGGTPAYQIVHGWKNTLKGSFTGAIGYENEIQNSSRPNHVSQNMAFAIGSENKIDATGYYMGDKNRVNTLPDYKEPGSNSNIVGADLYVIGRHNIIGSSKGGEWYVTRGHIIGTGNVIYSDSTNVFGDNNKVYSGSGIAIGNANKVGIDNAGNPVKNKVGRAIYNPVAVGHGNIVTGNYGVALGVTAESRGEEATAVGSTAEALSDYSAALGSENRASGYGSVAVGSSNNTYDFEANEGNGKWKKFDSGDSSSAVGVMNISTGNTSGAMGVMNISAGDSSSAVGVENKAEGEKSSSFGYSNTASGKNATAVGMENKASAEKASAMGYKNTVSGGMATAFGYSNQATEAYGFAAGSVNYAGGQYSTAVGGWNQAEGKKSQALGYRNFVSGYGAVSIGSENNLNFVKQYQALGFVQTGDLSSALGISNTTAGRKSMGIGSSNYAFGTKSAGIGMNNYSMGYETLAIGHYAVAGSKDPSKIDQVKYAAAIGNRAKSTITDAVAIGSFSNTTRDKGDYGYNPVLEKAVTDTDITDDANIGTYRTELENARAAWQTSMEKAEELLHKIHTQQYADEAEYQQWGAEYDRLNADADTKMAAYDAAQKKVSDLVGAWQGQMAALSVGDEATGRTRQITGVAAGSADTDAVNVAQLKALSTKVDNGGVHYLSVKGESQDADSNYKNDGAKGNGAVAIGEKAMATKGGTVSIGRNAHIGGDGGNTDGEGSVAIGDNSLITTNGLDLASIAIGKNAKVLNGSGKQEHGLSFTPDNFDKGNTLPKNADKVPGGIAIGTNSYARTGSIQLGHHTFAGYQMGGIDVTKANEEANIVGMTTVGTNTYNKGALANMYGAYSIITGNFTGAGGLNSLFYGPQNFGANVVGSLNSIRSKGHSGASGIANSIVGVANTVENANGTLVYGAGNKITNSIKAISADAGFATLKSWEDAVTGLQEVIKNSKSGGAVLAIGGGNVADYVRHSQLVGVNNTVTGTENKVSDFNMVNGYQNTGTNITHVTMIGSENTATDSESTLIMGDKQKVTKVKYGVLLGSQDAEKETTVSDVVAVGHNAYVEKEGGIALGSGSIASIDKGVFGYDPFTGKASTETSAIWKATQAAFSVGSTGDKNNLITRQITGVAAGSEDTDAVNVAQLKALDNKVTANSTAYTVETKENNDNTTTVTIKSNKAGDKGTTVTVATKDIHITSGTYDKNTKKLTFTTNTNTTFDVDMNDVINAAAEGSVHYLSVNSSEQGAGSNYKNDGAKAKDSIVLGVRSSSEGINGVVVGNDNKLTGNKNDQNNSVVIGTGLNVDGVHNIVVGTNYENYDQKETKVKGEQNTVIGNGNLVGYTAVKDPNDATKWTYTEVSTSGSDQNVVVGMCNTANGGSVAVGTDLEVENLGRAFGSGNKIIGSDNGGGQLGLALGSNNTVKGEMAVSVGTGTNAFGDWTVAIGAEAKTNETNSIAMGYQAETVKGWSAAIGSGAKTEGEASTAVGGLSASATVDYGAAFGSFSVAQRASGVAGYLANGQNTMAWQSNLGAFSVGDDVKGYSRQITGVAAGSEDTDAVNVAQLKAVESKITQTSGEAQKHTSVTAGKNISVAQNDNNAEGGKNYEVSLAKDIDLGQDGSIKAGNTTINKDGVTTNTVKAGDTTINNDGVTIKDGPVITKTNVDVNNQQIHHVKDGTADDDAATVGQVNKKIDEITKTVAGSSVTGGTIGEDGKISLTKADKTTVELQGQLKDISARAGDYEIKDNKVTIGLEDNYSKNAAGNIVIKDVAKASALEQETKERKDADKVITETIGAANKDELKTSYQNTTYIKNSTTLVEADKALDKAIGKNAGDIKKNTETINILGKQVGNLDTRVNKVGAGAAALAALHPLDFDPDDKWDFAAGYGNYKGANAAAIGAYYRPNEDTMFSVGGSFGGGENMVNAGVSVKLGQGNHVSTSKVAMAKDMLAMQKRMAEMEAQMAKMQGFIGALTGVDTQTAMFPDVPENHWAYEYVKGLCEQGIIEGYPDGNFNGNRSMTRYEFAAMLYRALAKGVNLDARAVKEFAPELGRIRVDVISQNKEGQPVIERVRVNEEKKEK